MIFNSFSFMSSRLTNTASVLKCSSSTLGLLLPFFISTPFTTWTISCTNTLPSSLVVNKNVSSNDTFKPVIAVSWHWISLNRCTRSSNVLLFNSSSEQSLPGTKGQGYTRTLPVLVPQINALLPRVTTICVIVTPPRPPPLLSTLLVSFLLLVRATATEPHEVDS